MDHALKQALLAHDRMVPRYTSYPTAPHFRTGADPLWYISELRKLPDKSDVSLYVHIPFCPKLCWFCGCNTRVTNRYGSVESYLRLLQRELKMLGPVISSKKLRVSHLHFGGGSPTILKPHDFRKFMEQLRKDFDFLPSAEIAIEVDPRNIDADKVRSYAAAGVNRASIGIQDFDDKVMESVNRPQSFDLDQRAISLFRDEGISRLNLDLMYGLPYQDTTTMKNCVDQALQLDPDRISLFGYAHVPWMKKHMRLIPEDALPNAEQRIDLFETGARLLEDAGYIPVGIDHFAKDNDSLCQSLRAGKLHRNFQGYTNDNAATMISLGASAIGYIGGHYVQNISALPQYRDRIESGSLAIDKSCTLTPEDHLRGQVISRLMCTLSVNPFHEADALNMGDHDYSEAYDRMMPLAKDGLVLISADGTIHALVRQAARLAAACFDTHLQTSPHQHASSS